MLSNLLLSASLLNSDLVYVGGATAQGTYECTVSLTSLTGGIGTAAIAGDVVIIFTANTTTSTREYYNHATTNNPVTYTSLVNINSNDTYPSFLRVGHRTMPSTPDTVVRASIGTITTESMVGIVSVWRNMGGIDVTTTTATGINSRIANPPAITPTTTGSIIIAAGAGGLSGTGYFASASGLTNFKQQARNSTYDISLGAGNYEDWISGAYDPAAFTLSGTDNTSNSWCACTIAIKP